MFIENHFHTYDFFGPFQSRKRLQIPFLSGHTCAMKLLEDLMLFGPNRRSENTLIELWLELSEAESQLMQASAVEIQARVIDTLEQQGLSPAPDHPLRQALDGTSAEIYASLVGGIMLALQQHAGHRVSFFALFPVAIENGVCVTVEYEHDDSGDEAKELAFHLLSELEPGIELSPQLIENYRGLTAHFDDYIKKAAACVLPRDTQIIIDVAERLGMPCVKLERRPYAGVKGSFRVRPNGLLKLGHACRQQVIDGSFCIDRNQSLVPLLTNRQEIHRLLIETGAPVARHDPEFQSCVTSKRASWVAKRIGFPVVVKPLSVARSRGDAGIALKLGDQAAVCLAARHCLRVNSGVMVEAYVPGETFKVIVSNLEVIAVVALTAGAASADVTAQTHVSILELAVRIADRLEPALMTLTLVSTDISEPLGQAGAVVNIDIAPELDAFLRDDGNAIMQSIHERAAEGLLRFLFPEGVETRIPLLTITGTNGKTTICAMIAKIMESAGYITGRAGTTGYFINDDCRDFEDFSGGSGHHKVLESAEVQCAVLESARGAASGMGFMYDWSDISVCSNVTADHLHERGITTVEQMAELKLLIMERARHAVVLNADDRLSSAMLPRLAGRKAWMVSARDTHEELQQRFGAAVSFAVAEMDAGTEWIKLYDEGREIPVMPVKQIPVTFDGRARFNVSNALQAVAACYQQGVAIEIIDSSLRVFHADHGTNPGRMNFYHGLPFTILMDYAHNEDGHRQLRSFIDTIEVAGSKVLAFALPGRLNNDEVLDLSRQIAGAYDFYVCRNYPTTYGRELHEIPALIKQGLMESGVPGKCILETPGDGYVEQALAVCRPGDLLVFCPSSKYLHEEWAQLTSFNYEEPT